MDEVIDVVSILSKIKSPRFLFISIGVISLFAVSIVFPLIFNDKTEGATTKKAILGESERRTTPTPGIKKEATTTPTHPIYKKTTVTVTSSPSTNNKFTNTQTTAASTQNETEAPTATITPPSPTQAQPTVPAYEFVPNGSWGDGCLNKTVAEEPSNEKIKQGISKEFSFEKKGMLVYSAMPELFTQVEKVNGTIVFPKQIITRSGNIIINDPGIYRVSISQVGAECPTWSFMMMYQK